MKILFWAVLLLVVYTYLLYPVALFVLAAFRKPFPPRRRSSATYEVGKVGVSIIVSEYNEEVVIEE